MPRESEGECECLSAIVSECEGVDSLGASLAFGRWVSTVAMGNKAIRIHALQTDKCTHTFTPHAHTHTHTHSHTLGRKRRREMC
jgi:hypothetical protein